jgi:hypothetical protein
MLGIVNFLKNVHEVGYSDMNDLMTDCLQQDTGLADSQSIGNPAQEEGELVENGQAQHGPRGTPSRESVSLSRTHHPYNLHLTCHHPSSIGRSS